MSTQSPTAEPETGTAQATPANPIILLLSLDKMDFWDEQYAPLVDILSSKATIKRVIKTSSAVTYLTDNKPTAIIITDGALTKRKRQFDAIRDQVVSYVRNGGTAVIGTHFSSFVTPPDTNHWFRTSWELPWKFGDYHRTTVYLNPNTNAGRLNKGSLSTSYSQKAVFLKNVARDAALYLPSDQSRTESAVFSPSPVDTEQTPVVFTPVGQGWLGYVGDVNSEEESFAAIVAMCGI